MNEHIDLGAYLLGGLAPAEHAAFEAHLAGCQQCQQEAKQFGAIGPRLRALDEATAHALLMERPAEQPAVQAADHWQAPGERTLDGLRARRRRRRIIQGAGFAAAVAASVALGLGLSPVLFPAQAPATDASYEMRNGTGAQVDLGLKAKAWGTEVHFDGRDLPTDGQLSLWVLDAAGSAEQAGAWLATTTGTTQLTGAVPVMLNDISVIQLRDAGSAVLAEVPLGRQGAS
ncbi:anti-sigma factor family protein [Glutamicibacter mysorens]|uniref:anti-sigma factor family protein n=1 Tax=Glutamicibacter mysorens TaxID=257984 RepID=UPI0020C5C791|nr:zf-HC2 domain-containing protein [Glutamicibacter mysorens]UTM48272.1 zf-HC2 domain-containing protein [Glutamicibacter mysorens]